MSDVEVQLIIGAKIVAVRPLTARELDREGWLGLAQPRQIAAGVVVELDNGMTLYPATDRDGTEPGVLMLYDPRAGTGESFWLRPKPRGES